MRGVTMGALLLLFIGVVVGLAMLPEIANYQHSMTNKLNAVNDSVDISAARLANGNINESVTFYVTYWNDEEWKQSECPLTSISATNGSGTAYTANTDYVFNATEGSFIMKNTTATVNSDNTTLWNYVYCADGYITDSAGRGVARLIAVFTALALVGFAVYYSVRQFF